MPTRNVFFFGPCVGTIEKQYAEMFKSRRLRVWKPGCSPAIPNDWVCDLEEGHFAERFSFPASSCEARMSYVSHRTLQTVEPLQMQFNSGVSAVRAPGPVRAIEGKQTGSNLKERQQAENCTN